MCWMIVFSVLLLLSPEPLSAAQAAVPLEGVHAELACADCHGASVAATPRPAAADNRAAGCTGCHAGYDGIFDQAMTRRTAEKTFAAESFGEYDPQFFATNCNSCHVSDCLDCHGGNGHRITAARQEDCLTCHKDYYVGWDYLGRAPREDHPRYQRGPSFQGEHALKMRPDIHAEKGLECMDCHDMQSLIAGETSARSCRDCHEPDPQVIEHGIAAHLEKMECYSCHSAWAAQEYGTFFLRIGADNPEAVERFRAAEAPSGDYLVRTYLRQQDTPPLGINSSGRVSPIRPQFIAYYSDLRQDGPPPVENRLVATQWKAFFPHTVRRGTPMCDACHDNPRRFLHEPEEDRIYRTDLDGLGLSSFWNQQGQTVVNGRFVEPQRYAEMMRRDAAYTKAYVEKWKSLIEHVGDSSKD